MDAYGHAPWLMFDVMMWASGGMQRAVLASRLQVEASLDLRVEGSMTSKSKSE